MNNWNRIFKPIVVLGVICVIVTGALAATNGVTAPIIQAATEAAETAARTELLPEADSFTEVKDVAVENVSGIYTAVALAGGGNHRAGAVVGGDVVVMVAFGPDDTIKQIKVTEQAETKGIGSNVVSSEEYWANYAGVSAEKALVLNQDVNAYSGATISSKAVLSAVNSAIDAYNQLP